MLIAHYTKRVALSIVRKPLFCCIVVLLLGVYLQELNLELESLVGTDVLTSTTLAVSHLGRNPECNLTANLNELHTLGPTLDNAVEGE